MPYSAPLDGIRALAILAVLIFHVSPGTLPGGFWGVDVFFVLSGFLITSILTHDLERDRFSFREFYLRRIQRLLPNLVAMVFGVLILWTVFLPSSTARQAGQHSLWTLFSASNLYIWQNLGDYWGNAAEQAPLTHTWSLGVEEQFYLLFPAALWLLAKSTRGRVRWWCLGVAALSFAASCYGTVVHPTATFYLLPTRVWQLLAGAALATTPLRLERRSRALCGGIGLAMIAGAVVFMGERTPLLGLAALIPTLGTVLLIISVGGVPDEQTPTARLLAYPPVVAVGKASYSLYLWHWPLIILGKIEADLLGLPLISGAIAGGIAGVILGTAAYLWVEQPLRGRGAGRRRRLAIIGAGFASVVVAAIVVSTRWPVADPTHRFDTPTFSGFLYDAAPPTSLDMSTVVRYYDVHFPPLVARPDDTWRTGGMVKLYGSPTPRVVVLGSSHALMYSRLIDDLCRDLGLSVAFLGVDRRAVFFGQPDAAEFDEARRRALTRWHPDLVFAIDRWDIRAQSADEFAGQLRQLVADLRPMTTTVAWIAQIPVAPGNNNINLREYVLWRMRDQATLPPLMPNANEALRREMVLAAERMATTDPMLRVVRTDQPFYQPDGSIRYANGRQFYYADDNHLTDAGANVTADLLRQVLAGLRR